MSSVFVAGRMVVAAGFLSVAISGSEVAAQQCAEGRWVMTWHDEFEGTTLDDAKWRAEDAYIHWNNELQYYSPQNAIVGDGALTILTERRQVGGRPYVSALVETVDRFSQMYGRFEVRAKLPKTQGMWPAQWMLPATRAWPPEIDIMELLGHDPFTVHMTNHWGTASNHQSQSTAFTGPDDFSLDFHTFRCDWFPGRIDWYVDDVLRASHHGNIPAEPFYLILNTAVGGNWPGPPNETTVFPQTHVIDYVRVYRYVAPLHELVNPGFEAANPLQNWTKAGNAFTSDQIPRSGFRGAKMYGNFTGSSNVSMMHQTLPAQPGQHWKARAWWMNPSWDRMQGGNTGTMKIEWRSGANAVIGSESITALTAASPTNVHSPVSLAATAPPGTASARLVMVFNQPAMASGAAYFDDCEFGQVVEPCCADFDGDGFITGSDFDAFSTAYGIGDTTADFDADGFVTGIDFDQYVGAFEAGC